MSNTILLKKSSTANSVPQAGNLSLGEVALNYTDGNLFYKDGGGTVQLLVSNKFVSVTGNITGGNLNAAGLSLSSNVVSALTVTGAIAGANLTTPGLISATGNITGGNLNAAGLSLSGNVLSQINSTSNITTSGNISGNYILGNIANATGFSASRIFNGTSEANIGTSDGNANISISGVSNVVVVTATGLNVTGTMSANGNITGGNLNAAGLSLSSNVVSVLNVTYQITGANLTTPGLISATGNITGGNLITSAAVSAASVSVSGNIDGGNLNVVSNVNAGWLSSSGTVVGTGTITGGNLATGGTASATGTITGGNLATGGTVSSTGNITGGNLVTGGIVSAGGNITGTGLHGSSLSLSSNVLSALNVTGAIAGANLTTPGLVSAGGNITGNNVSAAGNVIALDIRVGPGITGGTISALGNITSANTLNGVSLSLSGNVTSALNVTGNVTAGNLTTGGIISAGGNILGQSVSVSGTVTGASVVGGQITGTSLSVTGNVTGGNVNTNVIVGTSTTVKSTGDLSLSATGNIVVNSYINNVTTPVQDADAANKGYVDSVAQGLDPKASVAYATAAALPAYVYDNGVSGVGATITGNASAAISVDGSTPTVGDRILIKNESGAFVNNNTPSAAFNGIYVVTVVGELSPSPANFVLTRATDFNQPAEIPSAFTFVETGSTNADTGWVCTTNAPVTVGTTQIIFAQFSGAGSYTANTSAGLSLTGSVFSAKVDENTTAFDGAGNIIVKTSANLTTPNIGAATGTSLSVTGNITGGNLNAAGLSLSSNVVSALNVTGAIAGGNITTPGLISAAGTITGGNLAAGSGTISTSGNITGGNLNAAGLSLSSNVVSAFNVTGNITGGNVNGVVAVYSAGVQVLTINDTVDGGTY